MHALQKLSRNPPLAQWHIRSVARGRLQTPGAHSSKTSHSQSSTGATIRESSSSLSHTIHAAPITGGLESKTANQLLEPMCETHAAQQ